MCGVALSTTSMAVVYAVMLESGLNKTEFGKGILASCFINDLGTVIALGLPFAPFTYKAVVFVVAGTAVLASLPMLTEWLTRQYAYRTTAIRTLFCDRSFPARTNRALVLYPADVHRADLRDYFSLVRADSRHRHPRVIFISGLRRHRECGGADSHCRFVFSSRPPLAGIGTPWQIGP